jgi:beta-phosphoglucomutase-like phosphatase (HAD superfamily)
MFAAAITGDERWESPPQPDVYNLALKTLQHHFPTLDLQAENCLAIDHTFPGIDAAQHAGMQVVGISHTYPLHMLQRHASWAIDKFSELELERIEADFAQRNANPAA